jgi:flagellar biosynthesis protein FlhG
MAVASGKGGVGKTWLSITLADALARAGQRVLLLDCDLGLANVDIQLGLMAALDIGSVLQAAGRVEDAVVRLASGVHILTGRSGSGELATLGDTHLRTLRAAIAQAKPHYDFVLLDLSAGLDRFIREMCRSADRLLVVATCEPTSLTDAYAVMKLYQQDRSPEPPAVQLVINQASTTAAGEKTYATLVRATGSFLGFAPALAGVIRRDEKVRDAIRRQTLLLERHPNCHAAQDVMAIARRLAAQTR